MFSAPAPRPASPASPASPALPAPRLLTSPPPPAAGLPVPLCQQRCQLLLQAPRHRGPLHCDRRFRRQRRHRQAKLHQGVPTVLLFCFSCLASLGAFCRGLHTAPPGTTIGRPSFLASSAASSASCAAGPACLAGVAQSLACIKLAAHLDFLKHHPPSRSLPPLAISATCARTRHPRWARRNPPVSP